MGLASAYGSCRHKYDSYTLQADQKPETLHWKLAHFCPCQVMKKESQNRGALTTNTRSPPRLRITSFRDQPETLRASGELDAIAVVKEPCVLG
jgi:hypothetical protein